VLSPAGEEQVTGFHFAGDLLGLDGLARGGHATATIALEQGEFCAIPYPPLTAATEGGFELQQMVARMMSREIVRVHNLVMRLAMMSAQARLASFLIHLSQQMETRGYSPVEFHLRMSRAEIASYLGVKVETLSRTLSAFARRGLIRLNRKHVQILEFPGLQSCGQPGILIVDAASHSDSHIPPI
jgi:CRP/FNR family transcriptional regulator